MAITVNAFGKVAEFSEASELTREQAVSVALCLQWVLWLYPSLLNWLPPHKYTAAFIELASAATCKGERLEVAFGRNRPEVIDVFDWKRSAMADFNEVFNGRY